VLESIGKVAPPEVFLPKDMDVILAALRRHERTTFRREVTVGDLVFDESIFIAPEDNAVGIYATDITERKRTEQELRENEERFRLLVHQASDGIYVHELGEDLAGRILEVNDSICRMLGYSREEMLAMDVSDIRAPDGLAQMPEVISKLHTQGSLVFDTENRTKDGRTLPFEVNARLFNLQGRTVVLAIARDITQRKRTEQALRESENRFRQLSNSLPQLVWTCVPDGPCDFLSEQWVEYTGIPAEPQLGFGWLDQLHPDDREPTVAAWNAAVASGSDFRTEFRIRRHDGEYRWFDTRAVRLRDAQGHTVRWFGANTDVTEQKRAEQEKERMVRELERSKTELEQLIYAASHDLRTPLVSLQGFVGEIKLSLKDLLGELNGPDVSPAFRERIVGLVGADIPESLRFIDAGASRMGALVSGLLRLSRLGRTAFQAEPLDVNRVVGVVAHSLEFATREADAKVEVAVLPVCLGDPMQVGQIFSNLIENALKYRSPDRNLVVSITGRREKDNAVYCVEDNGIGIAPDQQQRVFTPFFRVDARIPDGEGLGLTIVTRIAERLGGRVWVESELGKGSRFHVALPIG
jgi:PAS domain S-box-containing protein